MSGSEAVGISFGLFIFSVVISIPFLVTTKLMRMFNEPGELDFIAFCMEDLTQFWQVPSFKMKSSISENFDRLGNS